MSHLHFAFKGSRLLSRCHSQSKKESLDFAVITSFEILKVMRGLLTKLARGLSHFILDVSMTS
jgi:hypothetical protein